MVRCGRRSGYESINGNSSHGLNNGLNRNHESDRTELYRYLHQWYNQNGGGNGNDKPRAKYDADGFGTDLHGGNVINKRNGNAVSAWWWQHSGSDLSVLNWWHGVQPGNSATDTGKRNSRQRTDCERRYGRHYLLGSGNKRVGLLKRPKRDGANVQLRMPTAGLCANQCETGYSSLNQRRVYG